MASALGLRVKFKGTTLQEFARRYKPDLSPTGMFVRTDEPLAVGSRVHFTFALENDAPLLGGEAVVVWVAEENKELNIPSGMELRFDSLAPDCQDRFHWLQMEKRGVTVGRELPVSVSTSSPSSSGSASAASASSASAAVTASDASAALAGASPAASPVTAADAAPGSAASGEDTEVVEVHTDELPLKRQTLPLGSKKPAEELLSARSTQPYVPSKAPLALRRPDPAAELLPGDSDPGKLFDSVASRSDPEISSRQEHARLARTTRPFLWGIGVGVLLLLGWVGYLSTRPKAPSPTRDTVVTRRDPAGPSRALRVVSDPAGAEVLLEGQLVGATPLVVQLEGTERVLVRRSGFVGESLALSKEAPGWKLEGQRLVLALDLKLQRAPQPAVPAEAAPVALAKGARPRVPRRGVRDPEARTTSQPRTDEPKTDEATAGTQATPPKSPPPDPPTEPAPKTEPRTEPTTAPVVKVPAPAKTPTKSPEWVKDPPTKAPGKIKKPSWTL